MESSKFISTMRRSHKPPVLDRDDDKTRPSNISEIAPQEWKTSDQSRACDLHPAQIIDAPSTCSEPICFVGSPHKIISGVQERPRSLALLAKLMTELLR